LESQKNFIYLLHQNVCPESPDIYLEHWKMASYFKWMISFKPN
jgi:hypothetical protein